MIISTEPIRCKLRSTRTAPKPQPGGGRTLAALLTLSRCSLVAVLPSSSERGAF
ncbi:hypothetical protein BN903_3 [Halorubrum sp. AJ67]|nr:hypothetical protein BN903_3 [Halorubrum sp. AJ67]